MRARFLTIGIPLFFLSLVLWLWFMPTARVGYAPEQPFDYNHKLHAGQYEIDCQYCHTGVDTSKKAGVPNLETCMNCHSVVGYGKENVEKLKEHWNEKRSPQWNRVHNLPDHVRFSHAPHINALLEEGKPTKTACMECHGDVASMEKVAQVKPHNMGWCVDCHRDYRDSDEYKNKGVSTDCNTCHY